MTLTIKRWMRWSLLIFLIHLVFIVSLKGLDPGVVSIQVHGFEIEMSQWWDLAIGPVFLGLFLLIQQKNKIDLFDSTVAPIAGLVVGLVVGYYGDIYIAVGAGLLCCLVTSLVVVDNPSVGLMCGLGIGLGVGFYLGVFAAIVLVLIAALGVILSLILKLVFSKETWIRMYQYMMVTEKG